MYQAKSKQYSCMHRWCGSCPRKIAGETTGSNKEVDLGEDTQPTVCRRRNIRGTLDRIIA